MVHIRDMLEYIASNVVRADGEAVDFRRPSVMPDLSVSLQSAGITRPVLFVPASMPVPALLARMKVSRTHMALVIDEYGGTDGLVSLEDLVELVVGDIEDEHDLGVEPEIRRVDERTFLVDARASFEDVFQAIGVPPPGTDLAEEVDTIGGYIMWLTGRLPDVGESIALDDRIEVEVVDADPRRLRRLRIHRQT
jgi:CBS domain containing-hemolysin-like protein